MPDSTWIKNELHTDKKTLLEIIAEWIKNNRQTAIGILVILLVIIVFSIFFYINYSKTNKIAQKELFIAQQVALGGRTDIGLKQLTDVEKNFPNKIEADFAIFTKADIYYSKGEYKQAQEEYEKIIKRAKNKDLLPFAYYSLAKTIQAQGDYNQAIIKLKEFITKFPEHFLAGNAYKSLAYCYAKTGDMQNAKETYEKMSVLFPDTSWSQEAKEKLGLK